ncbi:MAG: hypothetical protein AB7Q81_24470 [Gammaproteobacteria bacterium]
MSVVHLLNTGMQHPPERRRRFWIEAGRLIHVGQGCCLRLYVDREDGEYVTRLHFVSPREGAPSVRDVLRLDAWTWVDLSAHCGVMAIPRAFDTDLLERPVRLLIEFVTVDDDLAWVTPA